MSSGQIDEQPRHKQRRNLAIATLVKRDRSVVSLIQIPDPRPKSNARHLQVFARRRMPCSVLQGFVRGCYRVLGEEGHLAFFAGGQPVFCLPEAIVAAA